MTSNLGCDPPVKGNWFVDVSGDLVLYTFGNLFRGYLLVREGWQAGFLTGAHGSPVSYRPTDVGELRSKPNAEDFTSLHVADRMDGIHCRTTVTTCRYALKRVGTFAPLAFVPAPVNKFYRGMKPGHYPADDSAAVMTMAYHFNERANQLTDTREESSLVS